VVVLSNWPHVIPLFITCIRDYIKFWGLPILVLYFTLLWINWKCLQRCILCHWYPNVGALLWASLSYKTTKLKLTKQLHYLNILPIWKIWEKSSEEKQTESQWFYISMTLQTANHWLSYAADSNALHYSPKVDSSYPSYHKHLSSWLLTDAMNHIRVFL
jgi:hypothetical protein